jgi:hypothetical protein
MNSGDTGSPWGCGILQTQLTKKFLGSPNPEGRRTLPCIPGFEFLIKISFQLFLTHQTIKPQNNEKQTLDNLEIRPIGLRIKRDVVVFFLHQGEGPFSNLELHPWILGGE